MKINVIKKRNDYFMLYLLMGQSSMPFLVGDVFLIFGFLYSLYFFFARNHKIDSTVFKFSFIFLILFGIQVITSGDFTLSIVLAFMLRVFFGYFVIKMLAEKFPEYFIKVMYFFTIVSLILYVPLYLFSGFESFLTSNITPFFYMITYYKDYQHLIVFTFDLASKTEFPRNPGPFWEAGGFGIFLNIAVLFNLIKTKGIISKKNIFFFLAIITTQSTGTLITTFIIIISFFTSSKKVSNYILFLPLFLVLAFFAFDGLPFLREKIEKEMISAADDNYKESGITRLVSMRLDFDNFLKYPIAGTGRYKKTKLSVDDFHASEDYRNNGTTKLLAEFGIVGFLLYFYYYLKSFKYFCVINNFPKKFGLIMIITFLMAGFSQTIFTKPFFFSLCFVFCSYSTLIKSGTKNIAIL